MKHHRRFSCGRWGKKGDRLESLIQLQIQLCNKGNMLDLGIAKDTLFE